jgi:L-arabinokinase
MKTSSLRPVSAEAPGRLDFLGGVADYSGSLVLEMPTQVKTAVTLAGLESDKAVVSSVAFGEISLSLPPLRDLVARQASPRELRAHLEGAGIPGWARYPLGCLLVLACETGSFPSKGFRLDIHSTIPTGQGVSSSAALEIATLRAFNASMDLGLGHIELAHLGQKAENLIVGASCGLMDQLASSCGRQGALLPILCRPATLLPTVPLPEELVLVGWPSGVKHDVGGRPYAAARAAAFMGRRIVETLVHRRWTCGAEIPTEVFRRLEAQLPEYMSGAEYSRAYTDTDDPLTQIDPATPYPVRAAIRFPIEENERAARAREILENFSADRRGAAVELRKILHDSHRGYSAIGLGAPETDAMVQRLLEEPLEKGIIGGRISGGGAGGTVVVLLERRATEKLRGWATAAGTCLIL